MLWQSSDPLVSQRGWMEGKRERRWIRKKEKTNKKGRERGNKRHTEGERRKHKRKEEVEKMEKGKKRREKSSTSGSCGRQEGHGRVKADRSGGSSWL